MGFCQTKDTAMRLPGFPDMGANHLCCRQHSNDEIAVCGILHRDGYGLYAGI